MCRHIVLVIVGVVLAVSLGAAPPPTPTAAPPGPQAIQQVRLAAARVVGSQWQKIEGTQGAGVAVARPAAKMVWLGAVAVPGQTNVADAGFKVGPLSSGTAMRDVTVKATFEIHMFRGEVTCKLVVFEDLARQVAYNQWTANAAGTHDVTTAPFTMLAGKQYTVWASVLLRPGADPGEPGGVAVAKIPDVGWQL